jgi:hypothetical protein
MGRAYELSIGRLGLHDLYYLSTFTFRRLVRRLDLAVSYDTRNHIRRRLGWIL